MKEIRTIDNELWVMVFDAYNFNIDPEEHTEEELFDMLALIGGIRACVNLKKINQGD